MSRSGVRLSAQAELEAVVAVHALLQRRKGCSCAHADVRIEMTVDARVLEQ